MFSKHVKSSKALSDEILYEQIMTEIDSGLIRNGLWAKALVDADGDEQKAKARYIQYRLLTIKEEIETAEIHQAQLEAEAKTKAEEARKEHGFGDFSLAIKAVDILEEKGYRVIPGLRGWTVKEPSGQKRKFPTAEDLYGYTLSIDNQDKSLDASPINFREGQNDISIFAGYKFKWWHLFVVAAILKAISMLFRGP